MARSEGDELTDALLDMTSVLVGVAARSLDAGALGVTVIQHRILTLLAQRGELSIGQIGEELGIDQSNASRHCTRLNQLGAVDRVRNPDDLRSVSVTLSPAGREQVAAVRRARRRELSGMVASAGIDPAISRTIAELLRALGDGVSSASQGNDGSICSSARLPPHNPPPVGPVAD